VFYAEAEQDHPATRSIRTFEVDQASNFLTCLDELRNNVASI
jgi:hypothetical protein